MPLTEPTVKTLAAAGLIRAGLADDADAGVLIIQQNGGADRDHAQLEELLIATVALSVRVLLSACGYDVARAVKVIEQWQDRYATHPAIRHTP